MNEIRYHITINGLWRGLRIYIQKVVLDHVDQLPISHGFIVLAFLWCASGSASAQSVKYPVEIRPQMIIGGSVYLGDFTNPMATANKLRFTLTLQDPVETERTVYFRVTIAQNNTIIASNPIGFRGNQITLRKNEPYQITGEDLAQNLNINNLVGLSGPNAYGVLNEGITDICIEVIDVFREEPISRKECATGYLARLQPPLLILPMAGQNISGQQLNNTVFTWQMTDPLAHMPQTQISYKFELRKLSPGLNPQDDFENQILIFSDNLDHFSIFYNALTSQLEPGITYVWRVKAEFFNQQGIPEPNYFINNGISRIGVFQVLPDRMIRSESAGVSCFCPDNECDNISPVSSSAPREFVVGDSVRFGAFYMTINSQEGAGGSGTGSIHIPFLRTSIPVDYTGIEINKNFEVWSGQVSARASELVRDIAVDGERLQELTGQAGGLSWLQEMNQHVNENPGSLSLPVSLGRKLAVQGFEMPFEVFLTRIKFNSSGAATADLLMPITGKDGQVSYFGATGVRIGRHGFDLDGLKLYLINEKIELPGIGAEPLVVTRSVLDDPARGTYVSFNCEGLDQFNLQSSYEFPLDQLQPSDQSDQPVVATFILKGTSWGQFTGKGNIPSFTSTGAPGWKFNTEEILVDLDPLSNPSNILFPDTYSSGGDGWRGFYLSRARINIPKNINMAAGETVSFVTQGVLLDGNGINCRCGGSDVLNLATGKLGDWAYAIDTINLTVSQNIFVDAHVGGAMRIDVLDATLPYQGLILKDTRDNYFFNLSPVGSLEIPFLKISAEIERGSYLAIEKSLGSDSYRPYADLNMKVSIQVTEADFRNADLNSDVDHLKEVFGISDFDFKITGVTFKDFKINHPDLPTGKNFGLGSIEGGRVDIPGLNGITLSGLTLLDQESDFNGNKLPGLGLEMRVNFDLGLSSLGVGIWAKKDTPKAGVDYSFGKYELVVPDFIGVSFQCNCEESGGDAASDYCKDIDLNGGTSTTVNINDPIRVGHFVMQVIEINGDQGKGHVGIPFLTSKVMVRFENAVFHEMPDGSKRLVSGTVMTTQNDSQGNYKVKVGEDTGPTDLSELDDIPAFLDQIADISSQTADLFTLPVLLSTSIETFTGANLPEGFDFILLGVKFGPHHARLTAMITLKLPGENYMKFGLTGINIRPDGFNMEGIQIYLAEDFTMNIK